MENWLSKLERKFGRYAVPNLMSYITMPLPYLTSCIILLYCMRRDSY